MASRLGSPNKNTTQASKIAKKLGCDPFEILIHFAKGDWKALGYSEQKEVKFTPKGDPYEVDIINQELRLTAAKEATKYLYATIKAVEHSAADGTQLLTPVILRPSDIKTEPQAGSGLGVSE